MSTFLWQLNFNLKNKKIKPFQLSRKCSALEPWYPHEWLCWQWRQFSFQMIKEFRETINEILQINIFSFQLLITLHFLAKADFFSKDAFIHDVSISRCIWQVNVWNPFLCFTSPDVLLLNTLNELSYFEFHLSEINYLNVSDKPVCF